MNFFEHISPDTQFYQLPQPLRLESGRLLRDVQVAYRTWGKLNPQGDNGVLVCHALTGNADVDDWWAPLLGPERALDPQRDFVVCSNILGSCYGTTGPTSVNPDTGQPYGPDFPAITVRDIVHLQAHLLKALGVRSLRLVIGGSLGGMQVLEWAVQYPVWVRAIAVIAAPGRHSPWCIGLSEAQRQAIYTDPCWQEGRYSPAAPPVQGLATARMMAMSTYRSWANFNHRFARRLQTTSRHDATSPHPPQSPAFSVVEYLHRQGQKLVDRFDANTYVLLTQAMDSHDIAGGNQPHLTDSDQAALPAVEHCDSDRYPAILKGIEQPALIVAIDSDILYPPHEQQELAQLMPRAQLQWLHSPYGHDAFLIEMAALNAQVLTFQHFLVSSESPHTQAVELRKQTAELN